METADLKHCLELLTEALDLTQRLSGHIQDLKAYWEQTEAAEDFLAA